MMLSSQNLFKLISEVVIMARTTLTLSDPIAEALRVYAVQTRKNMHAQSEVVEDALKEYFDKRGVKINHQPSVPK